MANNYGIDKFSTTAQLLSVFRTEMYSVGSAFTIERIRIPLGAALAADMSLAAYIYYDVGDEGNTKVKALTLISTANFAAGTKKIIFNQQDIEDDNISPQNNFYIQFIWTGTVKLPVIFPIIITIDVKEDEGND
jgi:hypothetical protein